MNSFLQKQSLFALSIIFTILFCTTIVNASTGAPVNTAPIWTHSSGTSAITYAYSVLYNGVLYVGAKDYNANVFGNWLIEAYNATTGTQLWRKSYNPTGVAGSGSGYFSGMAVDGNGIYVVGANNNATTGLVEKLSLTDGSLKWTYSFPPPDGSTLTTGTQVATYNGQIYVTGTKSTPSLLIWKFDTNGTLLKTKEYLNPAGSNSTLWVDSTGLYYAIGNVLEKHSLVDFNLLTSQTAAITGITYITQWKGNWYLGGNTVASNFNGYNDIQWQIEQRSVSTFTQGWSQVSNHAVTYVGLAETVIAMALDDSGLYIVGHNGQDGSGNISMTFEKRRFEDGNLIWTRSEAGGGMGVQYVAGNMYVANSKQLEEFNMMACDDLNISPSNFTLDGQTSLFHVDVTLSNNSGKTFSGYTNATIKVLAPIGRIQNLSVTDSPTSRWFWNYANFIDACRDANGLSAWPSPVSPYWGCVIYSNPGLQTLLDTNVMLIAPNALNTASQAYVIPKTNFDGWTLESNIIYPFKIVTIPTLTTGQTYTVQIQRSLYDRTRNPLLTDVNFQLICSTPPTNSPPILQNFALTTSKNAPTATRYLNNYLFDESPSTVTYQIISENTAQVDCTISGQNLLYTPAANYTGTATCTIQVTDNGGLTDTAVATITVTNSSIINGSCGSANTKTYAYTDTNFGTDTFCTSGTQTPASISFPTAGNTATWACAGSGGGTTATCSATHAPTAISASVNYCMGVTLTYSSGLTGATYFVQRGSSSSGPFDTNLYPATFPYVTNPPTSGTNCYRLGATPASGPQVFSAPVCIDTNQLTGAYAADRCTATTAPVCGKKVQLTWPHNNDTFVSANWNTGAYGYDYLWAPTYYYVFRRDHNNLASYPTMPFLPGAYSPPWGAQDLTIFYPYVSGYFGPYLGGFTQATSTSVGATGQCRYMNNPIYDTNFVDVAPNGLATYDYVIIAARFRGTCSSYAKEVQLTYFGFFTAMSSVDCLGVSAGPDKTGYIDQPITIAGAITGGKTPYIFNWTLVTPDGNCALANTSTLSPTITCSTIGTRTIRLNATDSNGTPQTGFDYMNAIVTVNTSINGSCGDANKTYAYADTNFGTITGTTFCLTGTKNPSTIPPALLFPTAGNSVTWTCDSNNGGTSASCTARHGIDGNCGTNSRNYSSLETSFTGTFCTSGTTNPASPVFPTAATPSTWTCDGNNGGTTASCAATMLTGPQNGACGLIKNSCTQGMFIDTLDTATTYNWDCNGYLGGTTQHCTTTKIGSIGTTDENSITYFTATLTDKNLLFTIQCTHNLRADINLATLNGDDVTAQTMLGTIDCNTTPSTKSFVLPSPPTKTTNYRTTADITTHTTACVTCQQIAYVTYHPSSTGANTTPVPDNSLISIILVLASVLFIITHKKK